MIAGLACAPAAQAHDASASTNAVVRMNASADEREAALRIEALIRAADSGEPTTQKAYDAATLGMSALWMASTRMNPDIPSHLRPLLLMAEQAGRVRRTQRELLRLYDPPAYRAFYTEEGEPLQSWLAAALLRKDAPPNMPQAMVLAAPAPTMAWLEAHAEAAGKPSPLLIEILREWGNFVAHGGEQLYLPRLHALARRLAENPVVRDDERLLCAVLQFIGDTDYRDGAYTAADLLRHPTAAVRCAAATALARLKNDLALQALAERAAQESNTVVQTTIADALSQWPKAPEAGDACRRLYERAADAGVRRAVIQTAAFAEWPAREPLVRRAFEAGDDTTLIALAAKPVPGLEPELLRRLKNREGPFLNQYLMDAVAAARIEDAVPLLVEVLQRETNIAMRMKIATALETIGGNRAGAALLLLLEVNTDDLETESVVGALGRLRYAPAVPRLARIAKDRSVELGIRVQAIWALGRAGNDLANRELEEIQRQASDYFQAPTGTPMSKDLTTHARLVAPHLLLARFRLDPASMGDAIGRMFAETAPLEQVTLLAGLAEQKADHPVIALGLESGDYAVLSMAILAARTVNPAKYGPRVRRLAASPFIRALQDVPMEKYSWDLKSVLSEGWR